MSLKFDVPVRVHVCLGYERTIADVWQASTFLLDWTTRRQGAHYYAALDAASHAVRGTGTAAAAEDAFRQFAEHVGILAFEDEPVAA